MVISNTTFEMFNFFLERLSLFSYLFNKIFWETNGKFSNFIFYLTCSSLRSSLSNILIVNKICSSIFSTSLLNCVLACSRALRALRAWRAYVFGVLHEMACLACFKELACLTHFIKWRAWRALNWRNVFLMCLTKEQL